MANKNVVAEVVTHLNKAVKSGDDTVQQPSKWAAAAGFSGSEASPLRRIIARVSDNGCGRTGRYRPMSAEELLELIELGQAHQESTDAKKATISKRVHGKLYPATKQGAKSAKTAAKRSTRKRTAKA